MVVVVVVERSGKVRVVPVLVMGGKVTVMIVDVLVVDFVLPNGTSAGNAPRSA